MGCDDGLDELLEAFVNLMKLWNLLDNPIEITDGWKILETDVLQYKERQSQLKRTSTIFMKLPVRAKNGRKKKCKYLKKHREVPQVEITDPLNSPSGQNLLCILDVGHHLLDSILVTLQLSSEYYGENPEKKLHRQKGPFKLKGYLIGQIKLATENVSD